MSRSFAKPAFSRTATSNTKQSTTSTQNTFTFQNYLSYFGRWLEKSNELRSNWRSAPPPTAPPSSLSSTCWLDPFSSNVKKGKDTSMLGNVDEEDVEKDDQNKMSPWCLKWFWQQGKLSTNSGPNGHYKLQLCVGLNLKLDKLIINGEQETTLEKNDI